MTDPETPGPEDPFDLDEASKRWLEREFEKIQAPALESSRKVRILTSATAAKRKNWRWGLVAAATLLAGLLIWRQSKPMPPLPGTTPSLAMVLATDNPKINVYVVNHLPDDLWQGGFTP